VTEQLPALMTTFSSAPAKSPSNSSISSQSSS
jgi:hypothetical protein